MMRRPPRYTHGYVDRHGKPRWYLRRRGFKNVALPGLPWSPEFMAADEAAFAGQEPRQIGASRTKPGSMSALIVKFYRSGEWASLASSARNKESGWLPLRQFRQLTENPYPDLITHCLGYPL